MPMTVKTKTLTTVVLVLIIIVLLIVAIFTLTRPKSEGGLYERNVREGSVVYHPQIVSLTTAGPNRRTDREFACSGVILTNVWILVGGDCVETEDDWTKLEIRAGSVFWNKNGTIHKVEKYLHSHYEALTALKIYPSLEFTKHVDKVTLVDTEVDWKMAYTVDWYTETMHVHEKCLIETWIPGPCVDSEQKLGEIKDNASCKLKLHGKPLITKKHVLIGFHLGYSQINQDTSTRVFLDLQEGYYAQWVRTVVKDSNGEMVLKTTRKNITVCTFLSMYACQQLLSVVDYRKIAKQNSGNARRQRIKNILNGFPKFNTAVDFLTNEKVTMKYYSKTTNNERKKIESKKNDKSFISENIPISTIVSEVTTSESNISTEINLTTSEKLISNVTNKIMISTSSTTTEEPIWDILPLEESQFYNPV